MPKTSKTNSAIYTQPKSTKPRKPKEVAKPKRPLSAYFRFVAKVRPDLKKNNPDCKMTGISKLAAAQWHKLSEAKKKPFLDAFTREQPAHEEAMKTYKTSYAYKTFVKAKEQYEIEVEDWEEQQSE